MQMIRHQNKSMEFVKSPVSATHDLFDDYVRQLRVDKELMLLPGIGCHKIGTCLVDPPSDPSH